MRIRLFLCVKTLSLQKELALLSCFIIPPFSFILKFPPIKKIVLTIESHCIKINFKYKIFTDTV